MADSYYLKNISRMFLDRQQQMPKEFKNASEVELQSSITFPVSLGEEVSRTLKSFYVNCSTDVTSFNIKTIIYEWNCYIYGQIYF